MMEKNIKPLGQKAYGSIPHLPMSRMGPADHSCHQGQSDICTVKIRDKKDRVIVTEKLDGCCMAVARIGNEIVPLTRSGFHAKDGTYEHLRAFVPWVEKNYKSFRSVLADGERVCGEWLAMAHGTIYDVEKSPFIAFDVIAGKDRLPHDKVVSLCHDMGLTHAHVISDGPAIPVNDALALLGKFGYHGAQEPIEGAVWRVERDGKFDFMAKYVKPDKVDGKYLPNLSGNDPIWLYE